MHFSDIGRTLRYLKRNGIRDTRNAARERLREKDSYKYIPPTDEELLKQGTEADSFGVTVSIAVPAYETKTEYIRELVRSAAGQTYRKWELVIADASHDDKVYSAVCAAAAEFSLRITESGFESGTIKYIHLEHNDGIAANTDSALKYAEGDYICFLDHDDVITSDALWHVADAAVKNSHPVLIYSDEDKTDSSGRRYFDCNDKCTWNLDMLLSNNYICHLMTVRQDVFEKISFRSEYDGAQDYDLVLQTVGMLIKEGVSVAELGKYIIHVPRVLYHWRVHSQSTAGNTSSKTYAYEAGRRALEDFFTDRQIQVNVRHSKHLGYYETEYLPNVFSARPDVAIVCGRVFDRSGRMASCMADNDGNVLYSGMREGESGHMHRFDICQDVGTADIRCMRLRRSLWADFSEVMDCSYSEDPFTGMWDYSGWIEDYAQKHDGLQPDMTEYSEKLSKYVRNRGFIIMYTPKMKNVL